MTTVHLVSKTHLDIGFTDYAANVVQTYYRQFIPQAVALAKRTRESDQRFRWTTGAWLIYSYLEQASAEERRAMEEAITAGDIVWHGLPFTTHTELIDESLLRCALGYSQALDRRFDKQTIAAKLTDVPGHTRTLVPLLAEAGIRLLHIGVNPASSVPDVPPVFIWRDEATHTEIIVIYHQAYGGLTQIDGLDDALALFLTNDNEGPPTEASVAETFAALQTQMPDAHIIASTLDDFARPLDSVRDQLPVITSEIGDTWIHGAGTDPTKMRNYRELSRLRRQWLARDLSSDERSRLRRFSRSLLMIPEHTWGMDEKTHLFDHSHYLAPDLAALRQTDACQRFEQSWAEQRGYLTTALDALDPAFATEARERLQQITPQRPDLTTLALSPNTTLRNARFDVQFDPARGGIEHLTDLSTGFSWADADHVLARLRYEVFGQSDYDRFWEQYIRNQDDPEVEFWAREDFTKPGLPIRDHRVWQPTVTAAYRDGDARVIFALALPDDARQFGAPREFFLVYTLTDDSIEIALTWFDKPACRLAEAVWLSFQPRADQPDGWRFEKISQWINPRDVVSRGARTLHAVDQRVLYRDDARSFELTTLEAPLVAPGQPALLNFHNQLPDMRGGVHVNLYNNVWGTNFPMWFEDDSLFRFTLRFT
jgi:Domain of unknown function (DUF5054)/Glycosyl hydrolases family 38 N-terminal domain